MRVLLDTHVFLWANAAPDRLGPTGDLVRDANVECLLSAASAWEIAIKVSTGRLVLPDVAGRWVPDRTRALGLTPLAVEQAHALGVADLAPLHRDPFDRLLISQARSLGVPILTADRQVAAYEVESILIER